MRCWSAVLHFTPQKNPCVWPAPIRPSPVQELLTVLLAPFAPPAVHFADAPKECTGGDHRLQGRGEGMREERSALLLSGCSGRFSE